MITICTTLPWKCFGPKTKIEDKFKSTDIKFIHLNVQCTTLNVKHNCSSHKKQTHTKVFTYLPTVCVCVYVWVFVPHPFKALACIMTHQRQPQRQSDKDRRRQRQRQGERDSHHIPKWTTGKLQSYVLCTSCHINNAQMLCGCVFRSVCQSNFSLLLKCEWQLDALIVTMNCISSAIPCSVYATADSC